MTNPPPHIMSHAYLQAAPSIGGMYFLYELMMRRFSALEASQAAHAADAGANW